MKTDMQAGNLSLQHRCFPVNIAKFLRTAFFQSTSDGCFSLIKYCWDKRNPHWPAYFSVVNLNATPTLHFPESAKLRVLALYAPACLRVYAPYPVLISALHACMSLLSPISALPAIFCLSLCCFSCKIRHKT